LIASPNLTARKEVIAWEHNQPLALFTIAVPRETDAS